MAWEHLELEIAVEFSGHARAEKWHSDPFRSREHDKDDRWSFMTDRQRARHRENCRKYTAIKRAQAGLANLQNPKIVSCAGGCGARWCPIPRAGGRQRTCCSVACYRRARRNDPAKREKILAQGREEQRRRKARRRAAHEWPTVMEIQKLTASAGG